jgi:hypothetical protein
MDDSGMDWDWYYEQRQSQNETPEDLWEKEFRENERGGDDYDME